MFKKALKRLRGKPESPKEAAPPKKAPHSKSPPAKILTAEGWKRLMMKKYRKP